MGTLTLAANKKNHMQTAAARHLITSVLASDLKYEVCIANGRDEVESALKLRFDVFCKELGAGAASTMGRRDDIDDYDLCCRHLIVIERSTGETVGTYRLNSIETAGDKRGFYSFNEFTIEDLPRTVLENGIEIGRACIAVHHRNTKVLFLLWKALINYLMITEKRYFFGCCSIFTEDISIGERAFRQFAEGGHFHPHFRVEPRRNILYSNEAHSLDAAAIQIPTLFDMYLRIGASVCGPPTRDEDFGTIDFFMLLDILDLSPKYRRMFIQGSLAMAA